jgi:hypothetical protein
MLVLVLVEYLGFSRLNLKVGLDRARTCLFFLSKFGSDEVESGMYVLGTLRRVANAYRGKLAIELGVYQLHVWVTLPSVGSY